MNRRDVFVGIEKALTEVLEREVTDLSGDVRLFEDLNLDSTSVLELLMALEDNLGIEIDAESLDMEDFQTVGSLADYLARVASVAA